MIDRLTEADLATIERQSKGSYPYSNLERNFERLLAEVRALREERDALAEKVHFYEVQYQDEQGLHGCQEERDALRRRLDAVRKAAQAFETDLSTDCDGPARDALLAALDETS